MPFRKESDSEKVANKQKEPREKTLIVSMLLSLSILTVSREMPIRKKDTHTTTVASSACPMVTMNTFLTKGVRI